MATRQLEEDVCQCHEVGILSRVVHCATDGGPENVRDHEHARAARIIKSPSVTHSLSHLRPHPLAHPLAHLP
jgi:hypothetical protein